MSQGDDGARERPMYAFSDLVAARAARELTERGIQARRVREALIALRAQLPALDRPLLHLRVLSDGDRLVVAGDQPYEPLSGQRVMDFALDELSHKVAGLDAERGPQRDTERDAIPRAIAPDATRREASGPALAPTTALAWFEAGLAAVVAGEDERARAAYAQALVLDPQLGPAHTNLGALLADAGEHEAAARHLDAALRCDPTSILARMCRAALFERSGQDAEALALWASLLSDAPGRPPVRLGVLRAAAAVQRRAALTAL